MKVGGQHITEDQIARARSWCRAQHDFCATSLMDALVRIGIQQPPAYRVGRALIRRFHSEGMIEKAARYHHWRMVPPT